MTTAMKATTSVLINTTKKPQQYTAKQATRNHANVTTEYEKLSKARHTVHEKTVADEQIAFRRCNAETRKT